MLSIGICDDDKVLCGDLERRLYNLAKSNQIKIETVVFASGEELLNYIKGKNRLDLIFLDIQMDSLSGVDVGIQIRETYQNETILIVYISAMEKYAMQLFQVRPMDFLIKPIGDHELAHTFSVACRLLSDSSEYFEFNIQQTAYRIPLKEILYFESDGKKVRVVTRKSCQVFYRKLKDIAVELKDYGFVTIHKSLLVNQNQVIKYEYDQLMVSDGTVLPISQSNRTKIRQIQIQRRKETWR